MTPNLTKTNSADSLHSSKDVNQTWEREAERLYPYKAETYYTHNERMDHCRAAHIAACKLRAAEAEEARKELERLRGLIKKSVSPCDCESCTNTWKQFKIDNQL